MDSESQPLEAGAMPAHNHPLHPRTRAPSRASTASLQSNTQQQNLDQGFAPHHGAFPVNQQQWNAAQAHAHAHAQAQAQAQAQAHTHAHGHGHGPPRDMAMQAHHMPGDEMLLRPGSQMHPGQSFPMDSSMQTSMSHPMSFQHSMQHPSMSADSFNASASFADDSQMADRDDTGDGDSLNMANGKSSSNKTSANNEFEMRALFKANKHRKLGDVAEELHGNERGPNSERTRQVFAMLWINQVCATGKGSVPRGRVYANYASRCATERTTVLNPASFGKLVRVLFPGLKTRRLGVRGESKYHYVNFNLVDESAESQEPTQGDMSFQESGSFQQNASFPKSQSPAQNVPRAALPSPDLPLQPDAAAPSMLNYSRSHSFYNSQDFSSIDQVQSTTAKTALPMSFTPLPEEQFSDAIVLPRIEPFLPDNTDPDAAMSLAALYRSHCTSLVECIRYCRERNFFHLYTSFQGTLTMPVQKLFSNPDVALWIEQCDFVLYQRMMQIISNLTLQVIPKPVLDTLRSISERLVVHIREAFQGQPKHVILAKEAPASIFAALLDRTLRVNLAAHAAANMLANPANRDQMYMDWITMVRIRKVAEAVPSRGMDDVVMLLLNEMRDLLDPQNVPWDIECQTLYSDIATRSNKAPQGDNSGSDSGQLDRWVSLLHGLQTRFPYASAEDIVSSVQLAGNAAMRDITMAQGKSFGAWWVTKCWVDEMICFLAEQGGFMQLKSSHRKASSQILPSGQAPSRQMSHSVIRGQDKTNSNVSKPPIAQANRAPFPPQSDSHTRDSLGMSVNPDDSGIGMRTPEEEAPLEKYDFTQNHNHGLQTMGLEGEFTQQDGHL